MAQYTPLDEYTTDFDSYNRTKEEYSIFFEHLREMIDKHKIVYNYGQFVGGCGGELFVTTSVITNLTHHYDEGYVYICLPTNNNYLIGYFKSDEYDITKGVELANKMMEELGINRKIKFDGYCTRNINGLITYDKTGKKSVKYFLGYTN